MGGTIWVLLGQDTGDGVGGCVSFEDGREVRLEVTEDRGGSEKRLEGVERGAGSGSELKRDGRRFASEGGEREQDMRVARR